MILRDIKPGNIMLHGKSDEIALDKPLTSDVEVVITDFGLVRIEHAASQTASGMVSGTPSYMSPEQARADKTDHRTDIYSVGVVLYEMLAGRVPFEADSTMSVMYMQINEPPPSIPGVSPAIQAVMNRALAKKPDDRFQTCREMAVDFFLALGMTAEAETIIETLPADSPRRTEISIKPGASKPTTPKSKSTKVCDFARLGTPHGVTWIHHGDLSDAGVGSAATIFTMHTAVLLHGRTSVPKIITDASTAAKGAELGTDCGIVTGLWGETSDTVAGKYLFVLSPYAFARMEQRAAQIYMRRLLEPVAETHVLRCTRLPGNLDPYFDAPAGIANPEPFDDRAPVLDGLMLLPEPTQGMLWGKENDSKRSPYTAKPTDDTVAMAVVSWAGRNSSKVYLTTLLHMMLTIHIARGARPQLGVFNVDYTIAISPHREGFTTFAVFAEGVQIASCVTPTRPWY